MKDKQFGPEKVAMFVDCKQVGYSKFYHDGREKKKPTFSKRWKTEVKGTC